MDMGAVLSMTVLIGTPNLNGETQKRNENKFFHKNNFTLNANDLQLKNEKSYLSRALRTKSKELQTVGDVSEAFFL